MSHSKVDQFTTHTQQLKVDQQDHTQTVETVVCPVVDMVHAVTLPAAVAVDTVVYSRVITLKQVPYSSLAAAVEVLDTVVPVVPVVVKQQVPEQVAQVDHKQQVVTPVKHLADQHSKAVMLEVDKLLVLTTAAEAAAVISAAAVDTPMLELVAVDPDLFQQVRKSQTRQQLQDQDTHQQVHPIQIIRITEKAAQVEELQLPQTVTC